MAFLRLSIPKQARTYDTLAFFKFLLNKKARSTRLLAFLLLSMAKKARTYDTLAIFRIPAAQRRLEKGPEHETVGIFGTFNGKKSPEHKTVGLL